MSRPVSPIVAEWLLRLMARLPLSVLRGLGAVGGLLVYLARPRWRQRIHENLQTAGLGSSRTALLAAADAGRGALETAWIWFHSDDELARRTLCNELAADLLHPSRSSCEACQAPGPRLPNSAPSESGRHPMPEGGGQIILTPHLGAWELAGRMVGRIRPITVLYKAPRQAFLRDLIRRVRTHPTMEPVPADAGGVRSLLKALRQGRFIGILPDQVPTIGDGVWVPFFGRNAFTMTLPSRLAEKTSAPVSIVAAWRRPGGWAIEARHVAGGDGGHAPAPREINQAVEDMIRRHPVQYLWSYNRFKSPSNASMRSDEQEHSTGGATV